MARTPAALALLTALSLALAACGSPETAPADAPASTAPPAVDPTPVMPSDAPPQEEADGEIAAQDGPCVEAIGLTAATRLAERCAKVSPATRPPCNTANPCALIQDEIDRACGQYGPGETKPAECTA